MILNPDEIITFHSPLHFEDEKFFIPDYQRGYRWTEKEVGDLLEDIKNFIINNSKGSYSMQPIVVKMLNDNWEVVDGQQRLTTVLILLQALNIKNYYKIDYQVLDQSNMYVSDIRACENVEEINLFHMKTVFDFAVKWLNENLRTLSGYSIDDFKKFILEKLQFLWYRADMVDDSPGEKIFRRLNIGKIELTQSELIKALFLSDRNFRNTTSLNRKEEISRQWDQYEALLQNDEFWYFITNEAGNDSPTRIEFLLTEVVKLYHEELFKIKDISELNEPEGLFRIYYRIYRDETQSFIEIWDKCIDTIDILWQWYEDLNLYHLIGFIIQRGERSVSGLIKDWKNNFQSYFINEIIISYIRKNYIDTFDPDRVYGYFIENTNRWHDDKRQAFKWLLLINLLEVIRQNQTLKNNPNYAQGIYYKFPFHLFKKQEKSKGKGWDVEHIYSSTTNDLEDNRSRQDWILAAYMSLEEEKRELFMKNNEKLLHRFFTEKNEDNTHLFNNLHNILLNLLGIETETQSIDSKELAFKRNKITNFTLLDYKTNRLYKNSIFSTKRQHVRNKEIGILETPVWDNETKSIQIIQNKADSAFVPPCTMSVFLKAYSPTPYNFMEWTNDDANAYRNYIIDLFNWFKKHDWIYGK